MSDPNPVSTWQRPGGPWASGAVTSSGIPTQIPPPPDPAPPGEDGPRKRKRQIRIFGGIAGGVLALGLAIILIVAIGSDGDAFGGSEKADAPTDVRPPLAQMCPAPTVSPSAEGPGAGPPAAPPVTGERTVDEEAGISYRAYGDPWISWNTTWQAGTLAVRYKKGQHFVTETYAGGSYHASILSAAVPAADNDAVTLNLECVGRQVAADVRAEYYPQPNQMEKLRDGLATLGGRPAYVSKFRLSFDEPGLSAKSELAAIAVIDVGKPTAAVLYVSIPGTHPQFDPVVDQVLESVRPL